MCLDGTLQDRAVGSPLTGASTSYLYQQQVYIITPKQLQKKTRYKVLSGTRTHTDTTWGRSPRQLPDPLLLSYSNRETFSPASTASRPNNTAGLTQQKCAAFPLVMISSSVIIVMATIVCKPQAYDGLCKPQAYHQINVVACILVPFSLG